MPYSVDFTFKQKRKGEKVNLILFVIIKETDVYYDKEDKEALINEYIKLISESKDLYLYFDARNIRHIDKKLLWEGASDLAKHNDLFIKRIKATAVLLDNMLIKTIVETITKVTPFATPTKIFSKNDDAKQFLYGFM